MCVLYLVFLSKKDYTLCMNPKETIIAELQSINQYTGVIGTVSENSTPETSTMYYIQDNDLNIYFVTRSGSRKYKNITKNPHVSFVISSEHPPKTIQLEGVAGEVLDPNEQVDYFNKLIAKITESSAMPPVEQIVAGEMVFMKMTTTWARLGNFIVMKEGDKFIEITN